MKTLKKITGLLLIVCTTSLAYSQSNINIRYLYSALNNQQTMLQWAVEKAYTPYSMVIQRSTDGIHFKDYKVIEGKPSNYEMNYYHLDKKPLFGRCYYRIKIIENYNNTDELLSEITDVGQEIHFAQN